MNTATITDFANKFGLRAIVRRHFAYNKPILPVDSTALLALIYSRSIDPGLLGLTPEGSAQAFRQGELLDEMNLVPTLIISGIDQRNRDGADFTAAALMAAAKKKSVERSVYCQASPGVTYPYYNAKAVPTVWAKYGDFGAHAYLAGNSDTEGLWTEPASAFERRIMSAVHSTYPGNSLVLFDLNWEQLVLLHYLDVERRLSGQVPSMPGNWTPTLGGGIVYGVGWEVAEFNPDFTLVE